MLPQIPLPRVLKWHLLNVIVLLSFMTVMRFGFYLYFNQQGFRFTELVPAFVLGLRYDLRAVCLILLMFWMAGSLPVLNPFLGKRQYRSWMVVWYLLSFVFIFFYSIDLAHYAYLAQRLNASVLGYLEDTGISAEMVWQSYPLIRILLLIIAVTTGIGYVFRKIYQNTAQQVIPPPRRKRILIVSLVVILSCTAIFGRFNQYPLRWSDAFAMGSDYKANLALNPFESFFNTLRYRGKAFDEKEVREGVGFLSGYFGFDPSAGLPAAYARSVSPDSLKLRVRPNVILVICESFSAYKSSMWGNPLATTPFFDSLSRKGLFFDRCFTPTYGTARGVWATLTGLPDVDIRQTASRNPAAVDQQLILPQFKGYEKYYFIGGSPSWANIRGLLMNNIAGLHLYEEENLKSPRLDVWGVSDKNLFLEAVDILGQEKNPFFAVIQTADNHRPYSIPAEDTDFIIHNPSEDSLDRFGFKDQPSYEKKLKEFNAFRYTDYTFQKFIRAAEQQPFFSNTLFVFVGDHGIPGDVGDMLPSSWTTHRLSAVHVPLLFYAPAWLPARRDPRICSQIDVMPTIAGICGQPYINSALGRDISKGDNEKPFAFIFDPDQRKIGLVMGDYLYRTPLLKGKEEFVSASQGREMEKLTEGRKEEMRKLTKALFHTAGYLLLNNKKQGMHSGQ